MVHIIEFPDEFSRWEKEFDPFVKKVTKLILEESARYVAKHHAICLAEPEEARVALAAFASFICEALAASAKKSAIEIAGTEGRYEQYRDVLSERLR